jgi:NADH-quinone oxidoreductase subunit L
MEDRISQLLVLVPALPLGAAILVALLGPRMLKQHSHYPVVAALIASFICSLLLFGEVRHQTAASKPEHFLLENAGFERVVTLWTWADVDDAFEQPAGASRDFRVDIVLRADALTAIMLSMVTFVSSLVAIFAGGYMHGDRGYWRFFAYIGLFVFSMTMLVSVSNFVLLFVFWEAVGVCSYLLIGFWYEKPEAAAAGKKAFLVNRVGDFGFALALFLIWTTYGTLNFHDTRSDGTVDQQVVAETMESQPNEVITGVLGRWRIAKNEYATGNVALAICLLLLLGACGKSAQFPLHVWLADAMEGPTPVSALIHAATMVTAGVYMVTRCTPLFMASPEAQLTVACVGAFTALLAGLIALTQFDLKRVLAYSTISQLGYMFLALGVGTVTGISAGMFHLFTHAFFKALLFLGAGSVMHAMGNVIDMRRFGGLRKLMPITHATFLIGCIALAGIPPFAGFFSKDSIVAAVEERAHSLEHELEHRHAASNDHAEETESGTNPLATWTPEQLERFAHVYKWLFYSAMFTAFLTAFYTFRAYFMTFHGEERIPREAGHHAHESPAAMFWPLIGLAICAAVVGFSLDNTFARGGTHRFSEFLLQTPSLADGAAAATRGPFVFHWSVAGASFGIAVGGLLLATALYLGSSRNAERAKSLLDFEYLGIGHLVSPYKLSLHKFFFDEIYQLLIVWPLRAGAAVCYAVDRWIIDGLVNLAGRIPPLVGGLMRSLQMGLVQFYALAMVLGLLVLLAARIMLAAG